MNKFSRSCNTMSMLKYFIIISGVVYLVLIAGSVNSENNPQNLGHYLIDDNFSYPENVIFQDDAKL